MGGLKERKEAGAPPRVEVGKTWEGGGNMQQLPQLLVSSCGNLKERQGSLSGSGSPQDSPVFLGAGGREFGLWRKGNHSMLL